jgi:hypothetical protein
MRRVIAIVGSVELWALCCATGCVALPETPDEMSEALDAADVVRIELDGGPPRPPTGAPYTGPQCATQPPGAHDAGLAQAGASAPPVGQGDSAVAHAGAGGEGDAAIIPGQPAAARPTHVGDIVITELMVDPSAQRDDVGEWIELWNATTTDLELTGCTIDDGGATPRAISELVVAAMDVATIGRSLQVGFVPDVVAAISLSNTADSVALICDGLEIDRVSYGAGFPLRAGVSMSLDSASFDAADNDLPEVWCAATEVYATDRGTPGQLNPSCFAIADAGGADAGAQ